MRMRLYVVLTDVVYPELASRQRGIQLYKNELLCVNHCVIDNDDCHQPPKVKVLEGTLEPNTDYQCIQSPPPPAFPLCV